MKNKRVVLVTGASSGIGLAVCRVFKERGWHVVGSGRRFLKKTDHLARYFQADAMNPLDLENLVAGIRTKEQRLDVLINNAAYQICKPLIETSLEEWQDVFAVNVEAPFLLAKYTFPLLAKSKGAIVNVSSVHAAASSRNIASYAASKGALVSLTRNMAIEFAEKKIRVNAVLPGAVKTPMLEDGLARVSGSRKGLARQLQQFARKQLVDHVGDPREIAQIIYFLADNTQASYITGQTLIADGGALAKLSTE